MVIVFAILLFSLLIVVHELGHFMMAKLFKVRVNEFSIFMGPALIKWNRGETQYSIRCIPIGGYCAMEGENEESDDPHSFQKASWWKRLIILVAGAAMNFIVGLLLFAIVFVQNDRIRTLDFAEVEPVQIVADAEGLQIGDKVIEIDGIAFTKENEKEMEQLLLDGAAHDVVVRRGAETITLENLTVATTTTVWAQSGVQPGDRLEEINDENIYISGDFELLMSLEQDQKYDFVFDRNGEEVIIKDLYVPKTLFLDSGVLVERYGISFGSEEASFGSVTGYIWNNAVDAVRNVRLSLQMLLTGQAGVQDMAGPVGIVQMMTESVEDVEDTTTAVNTLLLFGAFIAVNLAVMNLLPIPALDGGHVISLLLVTAIEAITKKKVNPKVEGYIHGIGMILLLILMVLIMFKDVWGLFAG